MFIGVGDTVLDKLAELRIVLPQEEPRENDTALPRGSDIVLPRENDAVEGVQGKYIRKTGKVVKVYPAVNTTPLKVRVEFTNGTHALNAWTCFQHVGKNAVVGSVLDDGITDEVPDHGEEAIDTSIFRVVDGKTMVFATGIICI